MLARTTTEAALRGGASSVRQYRKMIGCSALGLPSSSASFSTQQQRQRMQSSTPSANASSFARRSFQTTAVTRIATRTMKDPNHPDGLYFHPLADSKQYAISLLDTPPPSSSSASIIGFIRSEHESSGTPIYDVAVRKPDLVHTHAPFIALLQDVLKNEAVAEDGLLEYEAYLRKDGFAHVSDPRHPLMPGRIPTPENIFGMVAFTESTVRPESYEANDVYRIVTSEEGFIQLRPNWLTLVLKRCTAQN